MLIRIFGITTPLGDHLYEKVLKNFYENIKCYSRSDKQNIYLDLRNINHPTLKKECNPMRYGFFYVPFGK